MRTPAANDAIGLHAEGFAAPGLPPSVRSGLCSLLRFTDALRAAVLGGRLAEALAVQARRDRLSQRLLAAPLPAAARSAVVTTLCAILDMDAAVTRCLEVNRAQAIADLVALEHRRSQLAGRPAQAR